MGTEQEEVKRESRGGVEEYWTRREAGKVTWISCKCRLTERQRGRGRRVIQSKKQTKKKTQKQKKNREDNSNQERLTILSSCRKEARRGK